MPFRQHQRVFPGPPDMGEPFNPWDSPPEVPFPFQPGPDRDPGFSDIPPEILAMIMGLIGKRTAKAAPVAPQFVNPPRPFFEAPVVGGQNSKVYKGALARIKAQGPQHPVRTPSMLEGFQGPQHPVGPRPEPRMPMAPPPMAPRGQNAMPGGGFGIGEPEEDFDPRNSPEFWGNWPYPKAKRPPSNAF